VKIRLGPGRLAGPIRIMPHWSRRLLTLRRPPPTAGKKARRDQQPPARRQSGEFGQEHGFAQQGGQKKSPQV
jgi:hypothetical protein